MGELQVTVNKIFSSSCKVWKFVYGPGVGGWWLYCGCVCVCVCVCVLFQIQKYIMISPKGIPNSWKANKIDLRFVPCLSEADKLSSLKWHKYLPPKWNVLFYLSKSNAAMNLRSNLSQSGMKNYLRSFFSCIEPTCNVWKTLTLLLQAGLCWCFHNPPNPDMNYRVINMHTWSFCMHKHTGDLGL